MIYLIIGKKGSGKTTLGKYIAKELGYCPHINFADSLKDLVHHGFGVKREFFEAGKKDTVSVGGKSVRKILQDTGTMMREYDPKIWIKMWMAKVDKVLGAGGQVVCSDLRYVNEFNSAKALYGAEVRLIHVMRDGCTDDDPHESENVWERLIPQANFSVRNNLSKDYLKTAAHKIVEENEHGR